MERRDTLARDYVFSLSCCRNLANVTYDSTNVIIKCIIYLVTMENSDDAKTPMINQSSEILDPR